VSAGGGARLEARGVTKIYADGAEGPLLTLDGVDVVAEP